jgi:hypothetical protein
LRSTVRNSPESNSTSRKALRMYSLSRMNNLNRKKKCGNSLF